MFVPNSNVWDFQLFHIFTNTFFCVCVTILVNVVVLHSHLIFIFLNNNDAEYFLKYLLAFEYSIFWSIFSRLLVSFKDIGWSVFFLLICRIFFLQMVAQMLKNLVAMWETWVRSLLGRSPGEENGYPFQYSCLEKFMEPSDRQSIGSQLVRHDWRDLAHNLNTNPFLHIF